MRGQRVLLNLRGNIFRQLRGAEIFRAALGVLVGVIVEAVERADFEDLFELDSSDAISADYIVSKLASAPSGTLVVVDYLQILDQKREKPELMVQIRTLQSFARARGLIFVFISQIDRSYDPAVKPCPDLKDIRLPNALDLTLFSKTCFLNNGEVQFRAAS